MKPSTLNSTPFMTRVNYGKTIIPEKTVLQQSIDGMTLHLKKKVHSHLRRQRIEQIIGELEYLKAYYYEQA